MKTKILLMLFAWLILMPDKAWSQCEATATNAVNTNGGMNNGTLPATGAPPYNTNQAIWPFLGQSCYTGSVTYTGPTIPNWSGASGTPDGNHTVGYVGAQSTVNASGQVYEAFFTRATLQPNTDYNISFRIAIKNIAGTQSSVVQIINQNNTAAFNYLCAGVTGLVPMNGSLMFNQVLTANTPAIGAPVFRTICGTYRTGATVTNDIILFRFSLNGVGGTSATTVSNYVYVDDFFIAPVNPATCANPVSITESCNGTQKVLTANLNPANANATYQWLLNGNPITGATGTSYTFQPSAATAGTYSVAVTSPTGCSAVASTVVTNYTIAVAASCSTAAATISPANASANYQWYKDGAIISGATAATYNMTQTGNYTVVASSTTMCPITSSAIAYTQPMIQLSETCLNGSRTLVSSVTGITNPVYRWSLNGSPIAGASSSSSFVPTASGSYTLTVTNAQGCSFQSSPIYFTFYTITLAQTCVNGVNVLQTTISPNLSNPNIRWTRNGTVITGVSGTSLNVSTAGLYTASIIANLGVCLITSNEYNFVPPTIRPIVICNSSGAKMLGIGGTPMPGATYQWEYNGSSIPGATQSTYTPTADGRYSVSVTSAAGCRYISENLNYVALKVSLNTPTLSALCQNQSNVTLTATVTGGSTPYSYTWTGPGAPITNVSSITVNQPGTYSVQIVDGNGCTTTATTTVLNSLSVICPAPVCPGGTPTLQLSNAQGVIGNYVAGWYNALDVSPNPELHSVITEEGDYYAVVVSPVCTLKTATPCHISFLAHPDPIVLSQTGSGFGCFNTVTNITVTNPAVNDHNADGNYFNDGVTYQWNTGEVNNLSNRTVTGYGSWNISAQDNTTGCITTSNTVGLSGPQLWINRVCVNGQVSLSATANFATTTWHWYLVTPGTGVRTEITNAAQLSNGGATLSVLQPGIYVVTNDGSNITCPGVEARIYENMVTTSPTHTNQVSARDGQFDGIPTCANYKAFTSGLAGCIDRSAYTTGDPNYIDPATYGMRLPDHYMINQNGLTANDWNPGYWQGTGYNSETFMIVDGQPNLSETVVWSLANVPVTSGYNYLYKAMVRNISANASSVGEEIPTLYLRVRFDNGSTYSDRRQVLYGNSQWVELTALAPALGYIDGALNVVQPTKATIEIVVDGGNIVGRDLGIDNITFVPYGLCDVVETACGSSATVAVSEKTVCAGSPVTFNVIDDAVNPNLQYNWTVKDAPGSVPVNTKDFTVTPTATTEYLLTVSNTQMQCSFTKTVKATVITPVQVNAGPDATICQGLSTQLNASGAVKYDWGNIATVSNRYIPNPMAGPLSTQVYTLTGTDASGCVTTDQVTVNVLYAPLVDPIKEITICPKGAASLIAKSAPTYTYEWSPATGLSSTSVYNPIATPATTTTYTVKVTRDNGCFINRTVTVNVASASCYIPNYDGLVDQTTAPSNPAYDFGTGDFTFEAWVQYATTQTTMPTILSRRVSGVAGYDGFLWGMMNSRQMVLQIGSVKCTSGTTPVVFDGMCHHLAVRRQGVIITFFVDGLPVSTWGNGTSVNAASVLRIGNDILGSTTAFKGGIQEVRMWNVARSNADIVSNLVKVFNTTTPNLVGYWRFKQQGQVAPDESATRNDAAYGLTTAVEAQDPTLNGTACAPLRTPENPSVTYPGVVYNYYVGNWTVLPDFYAMPAVKTGIWPTVTTGMQDQPDEFGVSYEGYINVAVDGYYTFFTNSDDGSRMFIGNNLVVNNDGVHTLQEKSGTIGLKAGKHAFKVIYFDQASADNLQLSYSGPGIAKQTVPATALFYTDDNLNQRRGTISSEVEHKAEVSIYPNPFEQSFKVLVADVNNATGVAELKLTNVFGLEVYSGTVLVNQENELNLDVPAGIYVATVTLKDGKSYQIKIVKTN